MNSYRQTPDLSKEFNPVPKPLAKIKMPKQLKKEGKKTLSWSEERKQLIKDFAQMGIKECELKFTACWKNNALGFAHIDKRRKLKVEDLPAVILACNPCHQAIELWPAVRMRAYLIDIIKERRKIT